jgi:hypothetical protein
LAQLSFRKEDAKGGKKSKTMPKNSYTFPTHLPSLNTTPSLNFLNNLIVTTMEMSDLNLKSWCKEDQSMLGRTHREGA